MLDMCFLGPCGILCGEYTGQDLPYVTPNKPREIFFSFQFFSFSFSFLYYYLSPSIPSLTQQVFMVFGALSSAETAVSKADLVPALGAERQAYYRKKTKKQ